MNEFAEFAKTQKLMTTKQNQLMETIIQRQFDSSAETKNFNDKEIEHVLTYGKWSNGKVHRSLLFFLTDEKHQTDEFPLCSLRIYFR